jgi:hypothetical protein
MNAINDAMAQRGISNFHMPLLCASGKQSTVTRKLTVAR